MQTNKFVIIGLMLLIIAINAVALIYFAPLGYYGVEVKLEGNTDPKKNAVIYVDGLRASEGEVYMSFITPREYKIELKHEGYESKTIVVKVKRFSIIQKPVEKYTLAKLYSFDIRSDPPGASIYLEGSPLELKTPATLKDLKSGKHTIKLDHEGYPPIGYTIDTAKDPVTMNFSFKQGMSATFKSIPNGATVFIDGNEMGITPCRIDGLAAKDYHLELRLEGYKPYKGFADIGLAGGNLEIKLDKLATVPVISDPSGLEVKVDGKVLGKTPLITYCDIGQHVYSISGKDIKLDVKGDQTIYEVFDKFEKEYIFVGQDGSVNSAKGPIGAFDPGLPKGKYAVYTQVDGGRLRLGTVDWQGKLLKMPSIEKAQKTTIECFESNDAITLVIKPATGKQEAEREELGTSKVEIDMATLVEKAGVKDSYVFEIGGGQLKTTLTLTKAEIIAGLRFVVEEKK